MKKIVLIICVFILFSNLKAEEISYKEESTVATKITESLESIYKELKTPTIYFYETSNFNCSNTGCTDSKFTNIGNISLFEYTRVGGNNSYLVDEKEFYAIYAINDNIPIAEPDVPPILIKFVQAILNIFGILATIPAIIISEIPFPIPF